MGYKTEQFVLNNFGLFSLDRNYEFLELNYHRTKKNPTKQAIFIFIMSYYFGLLANTSRKVPKNITNG